MGNDCCRFSGDMVNGALSEMPGKASSIFKTSYQKDKNLPREKEKMKMDWLKIPYLFIFTISNR